jgi:hypothetical protein
MFNSKINKTVEFELTLSIQITGDNSNQNICKNNQFHDKNGDKKSDKNTNKSFQNKRENLSTMCEYKLVGLITHYGSSVHSGHYVAFIQVALYFLSNILYLLINLDCYISYHLIFHILSPITVL